MSDELWAHSANDHGARHALADHLRGTAERARAFGDAFDAGDLAWFLGLVHDVGKGHCSWQDGLLAAEKTAKRVGIDHKYAGTWLARHAAGQLAMCVQGHHGGLPALAQLVKDLNGTPSVITKGWDATAVKVAEVVPEISAASASSLPPPWVAAGAADPTALDLLTRMTFSALVDADFLDTEAHFSGTSRPSSLVRGFAVMITELTGQDLPQWMAAAREAAIPGISSFAKGLEQDLDAVTSGLTTKWSSGPVEGRVNHVKMVKRQMFGRAGLPLLRKRVLLTARS